MARQRNLRDLAVVTPLAVLAAVSISNSLILFLRTPPLSWAFPITFIASVVLCAAFRIEVGNRSGMPFVGVVVTLLVVMSPDADPGRLIGVWTVGLFVAQIVARRDPLVGLYVTGLGTLGAVGFVATSRGLTNLAVPDLLALLPASVVYVGVILSIDFVRQGGRWGANGERGIDGLNVRRVLTATVLIWLIASTLHTVDVSVVPAMTNDPGIEQGPLVVLLTAAIVYGFAKRSEVATAQHRLEKVTAAALRLPWGERDEAHTTLISFAREAIAADNVVVRSTPAREHEISAGMDVPGQETEYVVATQRLSSVHYTADDERVLAALAHMASETMRARFDLETMQKRADLDALTGLPNYRAFQAALADANTHRGDDAGVAVLFIDLDDFKRINDGRGHHIGDAMLRLVARRLAAETSGNGFAARIGGDEFVAVLTGLASPDAARDATDRLVAALDRTEIVEGETLSPVVSVGVAYSEEPLADPSGLVVDADHTMLALKRSRRGTRQRVSSFDFPSAVDVRLHDAVERAVRTRMLDTHFQPIVQLRTGTIWGVEALVRYTDPELGALSPTAIIKTAKHRGILDALTMQVIDAAIAAGERFVQIDPAVSLVSVNVELAQIAEDRLGPLLLALPMRHPTIRICVELNERSMRHFDDEVRDQAQRLRDAGLLLALDDFGSRRSSVYALAAFPLDIVKIDRALIIDLADIRQRELVRSTQRFCDAVGYQVVVEGVETQETADTLMELGIAEVQGYHFGRPTPSILMEAQLREGREVVK